MTTTEDLIHRLSARPVPVKRLSPPAMRTLKWAAMVLPAVTILALTMGLRRDIGLRLAEPGFVITLVACVATAFAAALAALMQGVPGRSRLWALLPLPPLALWLAGFGRQCLLEFNGETEGELLAGPHLHCLPDITVMMALPTLAIMLMVRHGAGFERRLETLLAGLAAASLSNAALSLAHPNDAGLLVLLAQLVVVVVLSLWAGRRRPTLS